MKFLGVIKILIKTGQQTGTGTNRYRIGTELVERYVDRNRDEPEWNYRDE